MPDELETMLEKQKEELISSLVKQGALKSKCVIEAFRKLPRHKFVTDDYVNSAYMDIALPIIKNSTISQPYTVAVMTEALQPAAGDKILEIGSGSGWQACLLAHCVGDNGLVVSIEIDKDVHEFARKNVSKLGIKNIKLLVSDGSVGCKKFAPYDKIIFTCATPDIPKPFIEQLKVGGRIVAPVGSPANQRMLLIKKTAEDKLEQEEIEDVSFIFVPLTGKYGYKE